MKTIKSRNHRYTYRKVWVNDRRYVAWFEYDGKTSWVVADRYMHYGRRNYSLAGTPMREKLSYDYSGVYWPSDRYIFFNKHKADMENIALKLDNKLFGE